MRTTPAFKKFASSVAAIVAEFQASAAAEYDREQVERACAELATGTTFEEASKNTNPITAPAPLMRWWHHQREGRQELARKRVEAAWKIQRAHAVYAEECLAILSDNCSELEPIAVRTAADSVLGLAASVLAVHLLPWKDGHAYNGWLLARDGLEKTVAPDVASLFASI
jgi:hypothetical protein